MRFLLTFIFSCMIAVPAWAECSGYKGYPLSQVPPAGQAREEAWVAALAPIVANRRVVMLGEPSHGDGASIGLRAEIVKVLYEKFGFDVIVFEGDFYGLTFGWPEVRRASQVQPFSQSELYSFWSGSPAAAPLWSFVEDVKKRRKRLDIAGVDIRLGGARSRERIPGELSRIAAKTDTAVPAEAERALLDLLRDDLNPTATRDERAAFFLTLHALEQRVTGDGADATLVRSLIAWARFAWNNDNRDLGMAANLAWLADHRFPDRKIIVWAHSNHLLRNTSVWNGVSSEAPRHMGNLFAEGREDDVAVIGSIAFGGKFSTGFPTALSWRPFDMGKAADVPARSPDSLEADLAAHCVAPTIVRLDRTLPPQRFKASAIDLFFEADAVYANAFDALVFEGQARPLSGP